MAKTPNGARDVLDRLRAIESIPEIARGLKKLEAERIEAEKAQAVSEGDDRDAGGDK